MVDWVVKRLHGVYTLSLHDALPIWTVPPYWPNPDSTPQMATTISGARRRSWSPSGASNRGDRKSTRLNSSHTVISYAVFCLKKKKTQEAPWCLYRSGGMNQVQSQWH